MQAAAKRHKPAAGAARASGSQSISGLMPRASLSAASSASSARRVVGARAAAAAADDDVAEVDPAAMESDVLSPVAAAAAVRLPEPKPAAADVFRLQPQTAPLFHRYKQPEIDSVVGEVMKFALLQTSAGRIVAHKDVLTLLNDRCKGGAAHILKECKRRFAELYGYQLTELPKKDGSAAGKRRAAGDSSAATSTGSGNYILRMPTFASPALRRAYQSDLQLDRDNDAVARKGLLFWIYMLIHAEESGQNASSQDQVHGLLEERMWKVMQQRLDIDADTKHHEVFGNVANLIAEFVTQGYLSKTKLSDPARDAAVLDGRKAKDSFVYRMGVRGLEETSVEAVYRGMCSVVQGVPVNEAHLNQIHRNEEMAGRRKPKPAAAAAAAAADR